jgi:hypothetical protein
MPQGTAIIGDGEVHAEIVEAKIGDGDAGLEALHFDDHPVFDPFLEVDVLVQRNVRPVVDELDLSIGGTDAVDTPEALDDADGVPVNVVVIEVVAVLEVLALRDAVGADD